MSRISIHTRWLLLLLFVAFILRLYKLDTYGLYIDEKVTLLVSQAISPEGANQQDIFSKPSFTPHEFWRDKSIVDFNEAVARGDWGNSPAHYLVLNLWTKAFGLSDFSVRFLSVLFSVMLVVMLYIFVYQHFRNANLALIAAFLATIEPFFIAQSHIVRNYSMSLFFTLLASHFFLKIVSKEVKIKYYLFYSLAVTFSLLSHYLTFMVFVGHGLFTLLNVRDLKTYVGLVLSMLLPAVCLITWMTIGGGQYSLKTVKDVEEFYSSIAKHPPTPNPYAGWIDPATPQLVFTKTIHVLSDLFLTTNGLADILKGFKNLLLSLLVGCFTTFCVVAFLGSRLLRFLIAIVVIQVVGWFFYSQTSLYFIVFSFVPVIIWAFRRQFKKAKDDNYLFWFLLLMTFLPVGWMILQAFKAGHTVGINLRYMAFAFPYAIILVSIPLYAITRWEIGIRSIAYVIVACQLWFVSGTIRAIYNDQIPKYTYFSKPRTANPYAFIAHTLTNLYQPGDTIIYPSNTQSVFSAADTIKAAVSVLDAQLVNLYLPKEAEFQQKINPQEPNLVILWQKSTQKPKVIFNFEGLKFRY
ncbi:MAG: glycosyltransferase family 39 protein [Spirosomataceae bacterium]